MKGIFTFALGIAVSTATFGAVIDISTGTGNANWQVFNPGAATSLSVAQQNGTWAPAPTGTSWVSWGSVQGTSCTVGQTPGNGCANTLFNPAGDTWVYTLNVSAAALGATSGTLNILFGGDDSVTLQIGTGANQLSEQWAFSHLGCVTPTGPTDAGNTQVSYATCTSTVSFDATMLNGDGSLTLKGIDFNAPITGCPGCGDPTGFILDGDIVTGGVSSTPEPATFGLVALAGLAGFAIRRKRQV